MTLAILSSMPLDEIETIVREKTFHLIKQGESYDLNGFSQFGKPYTQYETGKLYKLHTTRKNKFLDIIY